MVEEPTGAAVVMTNLLERACSHELTASIVLTVKDIS